MCRTHLGDIFVILVAPVVFYAVSSLASCSGGTCLAGGFFFSAERNMLNNYALLSHVIENVTVSRPSKCFERCANDCRCISFNYLTTSVGENNCQLNEESRHTKREALQPQADSQYYDLVIDYNIKVEAPCGQCQNGCCQDQPCSNGGTCHETCDVMGPRFSCSCKPYFKGKYCETPNCPIGWLYFNNSCFKEFTTKLNWTDAKQACENMNSSLASIHSAEEDEFIASHVIAEDSDVVAIALFAVAFSRLRCNAFERECEAISGRNGKIARNCLTSTIRCIVVQVRGDNCEKGYWIQRHGKRRIFQVE